jgi:hypothetical protein
MQIGDLVRCMTVDGRPVGLVVERFVFVSKPTNHTDIFYVLIPGYEDPFPIRTSQMELVNASR